VTNLLVTKLLVTLSPTDAGVQRGAGGENGVQGVATLAHPRKVGLNIPIRLFFLIRLYLVETAEVMPVSSEYSSVRHGHILPRDVHREFTDDLSKLFLVFVFPHLVFT
jgi:hypothetical protein